MRTYDEILNSMCEKYMEQTGVYPDEASDIGIRMAVLAGEIFSAQTTSEWIKAQMFPMTASGEYLDLHAAQRGLARKSGTKAHGEVTFYVAEALTYDITVPKGTVCATGGDDSVRFVTLGDVVLSAGDLSVTAQVEATEKGKKSNVAAAKVLILVTAVSGISYIRNNSKITGGSDDESDTKLRKRIINSFTVVPNGMNKEYYIQCAMEVDGVKAAGAIPRNRGVGTVDVFVLSENKDAPQELLDRVKEYLDSKREINVDIQVRALRYYSISMAVTLGIKSGYDFDAVAAECRSAIEEYIDSTNAGENIYLSDIGEIIAHIDGVEDYTFNSGYDHEPRGDSVASADNIIFEERV